MAKSWVNVGIVGCGRIYADGHRKGYVHPASTNNAVIAFCDVQEKLAKEQLNWIKKEYQGQLKQARKHSNSHEVERLQFALDHLKVFTSFDTMLAELDGTLDVIDNCTPGRLHVPLSIQAMARGVHAMSEKPPGLNWWDAKRAVEAEQKTKKSFHLMEVVCYDRPLQKCRQIIQDGTLGKIFHCEVPYGHGGPYLPQFFAPGGLPHFIDPLWAGGGVTQDLAPHGIAKGLWPVGPDARVVACTTKALERRRNPRLMKKKPFPSTVDDWAEASLECYDPRTKSNFTMHALSSWCGAPGFNFSIEGDKGSLTVEKGQPVITSPDGTKVAFPIDYDEWADDMYHREIQIFAEQILCGQPSDTPATFALALQETLSIQYFAKLQKKRVTLEEMDRWGAEIAAQNPDPQNAVDGITQALLKAVDLL